MKRLHTLTPLLIVFLVCGTPSFSQYSWNEVYSDIVYPYNSTQIAAITQSPAGNILYAAMDKKVFKWDGSYWTELGNLDADYRVLTMTTDPAGNVYAAGWFTNANGKHYVAKWNGSNWSELGGANALNAGGPIKSITSDAAGNIYAAGWFRNTLGKIYVAKFNGTSWSEVGGIGAFNVNEYIASLCVDASGNLYAAGLFTNSFNKQYVCKFNGTTWAELGSVNALGANGFISTVTTDAAGNVYCGGQFGNASGKRYIAKYNGTAWSELGGANALNGNAGVNTIITDVSGNVYAAGAFSNTTGQYVAKWNGTNWSQLGNFDANYAINILLKDAAGNIYAAGDFVNGTGHCFVNKWTAGNNTWAEINAGGIGILHTGDAEVLAITADSSGNIYAAGNYVSAGGGRNVSKWNGHVWSELGSGTTGINGNGWINTLATDATGNVYAAGGFYHGMNNRRYVAKWDGTSWTELGAGGNELNANDHIYTIAIDAANNIYAAGAFTNASGKYGVWKWNGSTWAEMGTGINSLNSDAQIYSIKLDTAGNVYARARKLVSTYYIAKWNGTNWTEVGAGAPGYHPEDLTGAMAFDNAGNLYAQADVIINSNFVTCVLKWDGTAWTPFAGINDKVGKGGFFFSDAAGNVYFGGVPFDHQGRIDKWNGTSFTKLGDIKFPDEAYVCVVAPDGRVYAGGKFNRNGRTCGVTVYDSTFLFQPEIVDIRNKCRNDTTSKGKLADPPANTTITVSLDGNPITYSASDKTFTYFINGVTSPGNHTISVKYNNGVNIVQKDSVYTVNENVTPAISIGGNLIVKPGQSTNLTLSATHPGTAPGYQWQDSVNSYGWQNIPSAQGTILTYTPAETGDKVRCILNSNADCKLLQYITSQPVQFTVNAVTAIDPVPSNQYGIRVYPNPASSTLTIDSLKATDKWQMLVIQSIDGKKVFAEQYISNRTIVTQTLVGLRKGIYIISLRKKNGAGAFFKLVKM